MSVKTSVTKLEKQFGRNGPRTRIFIRYDEEPRPDDGRLWIEADTSDESARETPDGVRYRIGTDWHTAEELEALGIAPVVVSFGRTVPAPDNLQPSP